MSVALVAPLEGGSAPLTEPQPRPPTDAPDDHSTQELSATLAALREHQRTADALLEQVRSRTVATEHTAAFLAARLEELRATVSEQRQAELASLVELRRQSLLTFRVTAVVVGGLMLGLAALTVLALRVMRRVVALRDELRESLGHRPALADRSLPPSLGQPVADVGRRLDSLESAVCHRPGTTTTAAPPVVVAEPAQDRARDLASLMTTGKSALRRGQPQEALDCFDAILRFCPTHIEALVKQGRTLELLGRASEAIESYERALAVDAGMAAAFLGKSEVASLLEQPSVKPLPATALTGRTLKPHPPPVGTP